MDLETCYELVFNSKDLTEKQKRIMYYNINCIHNIYNIYNINFVFNNILIKLNYKNNTVILYIFEENYYIYKEIKYYRETNVYDICISMYKFVDENININKQTVIFIASNIFINKNDDYYGEMTLIENHDLINIGKRYMYNNYRFDSIDDRNNILKHVDEKINYVTIDYTLYQLLLDCPNVSKILLNMLDSLGITINKFQFID